VPVAHWTFITNHARILVCVARDPGVRHRDLAELIGITERAAQRIVADLVEAGYLDVVREGRRNRYRLHPELQMRHPLEHDHQIGEILAVLQPIGDEARSGRSS
jgi:DNA-binding IclR family transcriptional regulator